MRMSFSRSRRRLTTSRVEECRISASIRSSSEDEESFFGLSASDMSASGEVPSSLAFLSCSRSSRSSRVDMMGERVNERRYAGMGEVRGEVSVI
jgi:hypothetical protein